MSHSTKPKTYSDIILFIFMIYDLTMHAIIIFLDIVRYQV